MLSWIWGLEGAAGKCIHFLNLTVSASGGFWGGIFYFSAVVVLGDSCPASRKGRARGCGGW